MAEGVNLGSMKLYLIASVAAAALAFTERAAAQGQDHFAFGVAGGVAVATDHLRTLHTNGPTGMLSLAIGAVDTPVGVRFDLMYSAFGERAGSGAFPRQGKARIIGLTGNVVLPILGQSNRLYTIAGVGGYGYRPDATGPENGTNFGLNAGLGVWIPRVSGFVEGRFHNVYRALPDRADATRNARSARYYPITFGLLF